jgi:hypothetical protein
VHSEERAISLSKNSLGWIPGQRKLSGQTMNEAEIRAQVPFSNAVCLCGKKLAEHSLDELRACAIKFGGSQRTASTSRERISNINRNQEEKAETP